MDKKLKTRTKKKFDEDRKYKNQINKIMKYEETFCISCECINRDRTGPPCRVCLMRSINKRTKKPAFYKERIVQNEK